MGSVLINGYKGSIYPEGSGYTGVLDLGWTADGKRNRPKRKGRTKALVKAKLVELANSINRAIVYRYCPENISLHVARPRGTESNLRKSKSFTVAQTEAILSFPRASRRSSGSADTSPLR